MKTEAQHQEIIDNTTLLLNWIKLIDEEQKYLNLDTYEDILETAILISGTENVLQNLKNK